MRRREFIAFLGVAAVFPVATNAQSKIPRIGFMGNSTAALEANLVDAFREGLRELGYEEGRNIVIEYRWADGEYERFSTLVAELIGAKVDVIVTAGTPAALAVKRATTTVPLVMVAVGDPVGTGLVPSLARPGGNLTGLSSIAPASRANGSNFCAKSCLRFRMSVCLLIRLIHFMFLRWDKLAPPPREWE
jgi:putative ABC transport system substrate-binding protein